MTISLSNNAARQSYAVAQGATQSSFTVGFEFFDDDDLTLYVDGTAKTITTHYTVSGGDGSTGTITMTTGNEVTGITGGSTVVVTRDIDLDRITDFPSSGPFAVATLNTELDRFTAIAADQKDEVDRSLRLQDFDSAVTMTLPLKADRLGTVLGFNATTGAPEAGPTIANVNSLASITTNINTVAGIQANVTTVAGIQANVTTVAGISGNVTTVAGISSDVTTVAGDAADIATVAGISSNVTAVAAKASLITSDFVSDLNTLAVTDVINDINTLATSDIVSDLNTLATSDIVSDLNTLATSDIVSDINTLATSDIVTDLNLLATSDFVSDLNTMATSTNVTNLGTVAGAVSNINTVAGVASNVTTVAGISSDVTSVAGKATEIGLLGVSSVITNMGTLGTSDAVSDMNTLAAISSDITSLAGALEKTYTVTVTNPGSGNVFVLDGDNNPTITIFRGNTYIFDQSDSSNSGHPIAFKDSGGSAYTSGITSTGTPGSSGAKTTFNVPSDAPNSLRYYCTAHGNSMGNTITVTDSNISLVATNIANVNTVGGAITNVNNVGGSIANVNTVASNLSGVNSFGERYRVGSSDPTSSLDEGDLFYNSTDNALKYYNGTSWASITAGLTDIVADVTPQLGGNLDVNGNSIVSTSNGNITIAPNGTGDVHLDADTVRVGDSNADATITTNGTGDLTINTNGGTNSGSIVVADAANGDISITPNGTGSVVIDGLSHPQADGSAGQFMKTDGSGQLSFGTVNTDLSNDSSPQLGGNLDTNGNAILFGSSKWSIELDTGDNDLLFKYNGTTVFKLASNGAVTSANDVTAFGSP